MTPTKRKVVPRLADLIAAHKLAEDEYYAHKSEQPEGVSASLEWKAEEARLLKELRDATATKWRRMLEEESVKGRRK